MPVSEFQYYYDDRKTRFPFSEFLAFILFLFLLFTLCQNDISEKQTKVFSVDPRIDFFIHLDGNSFSVTAGKTERTDKLDSILQSIFLDCFFKHCDKFFRSFQMTGRTDTNCNCHNILSVSVIHIITVFITK